MLTTFLVVHPWVTTVALAASVLLGPLVGFVLVDRRQLAVRCATVLALVAIALTTFPTSRSLEMGCAAEWSVPTLGAVELIANVVLFILPTLLFAVAWRRPLVTLVIASGASVLIEAVQGLAPALGRSCSTNDWLSNFLGAAVGALIALAVLRVHAGRTVRVPPEN